MSIDKNTINYSSLSSLIHRAGPAITGAIQKASASTGVNFSYLLQKASVESSFKANAKAPTSSASGLFQFIDKTWMSMVKKYGDKYGMGNLADKIDDQGHCSDKTARAKILSLRNDPEKAACLAAEYAAENKTYLQQHTNAQVGSTELYLAHFMGASGASDFLNNLQNHPDAKAADLFPKAAVSNHNVFYDAKTGQARSLQGVYDFFAGKFQADDGGTAVATDAPASLTVADASPIRASDIMWNMSERDAIQLLNSRTAANGTFARSPIGGTGAMTTNPVDIMMMAQLDLPGSNKTMSN